MERRKFIKKCSAVSLGCMAGQTLLTSCSSAVYVTHRVENNKIIVKKNDFVAAETDYVLIKNDKLPAPIYLKKHSEEKYSAVLMECTHKACEIQPFGDQLHCPCHGSEFTSTGEVLEGPAEEPLQKFKVFFDLENVYIS